MSSGFWAVFPDEMLVSSMSSGFWAVFPDGMPEFRLYERGAFVGEQVTCVFDDNA